MKKEEMKKSSKSKMLARLSKEMKEMSREGYESSPLSEKMKVTVAANDEEGLKEGLSKAQQIMKEKLGEDSEEKSEKEESSSEMSKEDIQDKIAELQQQLSDKE